MCSCGLALNQLFIIIFLPGWGKFKSTMIVDNWLLVNLLGIGTANFEWHICECETRETISSYWTCWSRKSMPKKLFRKQRVNFSLIVQLPIIWTSIHVNFFISMLIMIHLMKYLYLFMHILIKIKLMRIFFEISFFYNFFSLPCWWVFCMSYHRRKVVWKCEERSHTLPSSPGCFLPVSDKILFSETSLIMLVTARSSRLVH